MNSQHLPLQPGQVWSFETRPELRDARAVILRVDSNEEFGPLVHIALINLHGLNSLHPEWDGNFGDHVEHLPMSQDAVLSSITDFVGTAENLPPFETGYQMWVDAVSSKNGGVFAISIDSVIQVIEQSRSQIMGQVPPLQ